MVEKLAQFEKDIRCCLVVGGLSTKVQEAALRSKPDIVVATPRRMIDHIRNSLSVHLDELAVLILDEADRLLELGFSAEIRELVVEVSTSNTGKHGQAKCHFVGIDIFNGKKLEDIVPSSHNCDVPHVTPRTDYQQIDISEDGFIKDGFAQGKDIVVSVLSAMGEEQINALKDIGPN